MSKEHKWSHGGAPAWKTKEKSWMLVFQALLWPQKSIHVCRKKIGRLWQWDTCDWSLKMEILTKKRIRKNASKNLANRISGEVIVLQEAIMTLGKKNLCV